MPCQARLFGGLVLEEDVGTKFSGFSGGVIVAVLEGVGESVHAEHVETPVVHKCRDIGHASEELLDARPKVPRARTSPLGSLLL